jgi:hypothetical protein
VCSRYDASLPTRRAPRNHSWPATRPPSPSSRGGSGIPCLACARREGRTPMTRRYGRARLVRPGAGGCPRRRFCCPRDAAAPAPGPITVIIARGVGYRPAGRGALNRLSESEVVRDYRWMETFRLRVRRMSAHGGAGTGPNWGGRRAISLESVKGGRPSPLQAGSQPSVPSPVRRAVILRSPTSHRHSRAAPCMSNENSVTAAPTGSTTPSGPRVPAPDTAARVALLQRVKNAVPPEVGQAANGLSG